MDLGQLREAVATTIATVPDVRVDAVVPASTSAGALTHVVLEPGTPYVVYPTARGKALSRQAEVAFTVVIVPGTVDTAEAQRVIDRHLSSGSGRLHSIRDALEGLQSHGGTACQTNVLQARVVTMPIGGVDRLAGEMDITILVRTD